MTNIGQLKDSKGNPFYPQTHVDAILDLSKTIEENLIVKSVNSKIGDVVLIANDVGAYTKEEVDSLLEEKQDLVLVSPSGNKFILSVNDDGTIITTPYV